MSQGRSNVYKLRDIINAKDPVYGAKGDGTTDDAAALLAAFAAVPANGGAIYLPAGSYLCASQLTHTKRIKIIGEGTSESAASNGVTRIIKKSTMTTPVLVISKHNSAVHGVEFEGEAGNTGDGVQILANRVHLVDVSSYSMGQDGIRIGSEAGGENCNLWLLENVKSKSNTRYGIYIHDGSTTVSPNVNGGTMIHPDVQSNGSDGVRYGSARLNTQLGGAIQSNIGNGVTLTADAKYNIFFGGNWEGNAKDLVTTSGGTGNQIYNPTLAAANCTFGEIDNKYDILNSPQLSWTPTITFATGGDLAVTYSVRAGRITISDDEVTADFEIVTSAFTHSTAAGNLQITGLPITAKGGASGVFPVGTILFGGWTLAGTSGIAPQVLGGTGTIQVYANRSGATVIPLTTAHVPSGASVLIYGQVKYRRA